MLSVDAFSRAQMRLAAGCTGTRRGSLSAPPDLLVAIGDGVMLLTGREEREGKGMDCLLFNLTSGYGPGFYVHLKLFMFIANFWYYVVFCYLDTV